MFSRVLARASQNKTLERVVTRQPLSRRLAMRFVAGETVDAGLDAVAAAAATGRTGTLDYVGEYVEDVEAARTAALTYHHCLDRIDERGLPSGISVKPSQLGLLTHPQTCAELTDDIATAAKRIGAHVTLDMEASDSTEATIALVERIQAAGHSHVGCAVQSYLHRTESDVVRLSRAGASLRLCKGAYAEPLHLAYQRREDVDASFARCASYLLEHGTYPRFATHDGRLVHHIRLEADRLGRGPDSYEFQMLHGVREELQNALVAAGFAVRVYVPFGDNWYAYFMRRLAERPANLFFFVRALRGR